MKEGTKFLYHFCSMRQLADSVNLEYNSGSLETDGPIITNDDYSKLRTKIAELCKVKAKGLIILTLTLIYNPTY